MLFRSLTSLQHPGSSAARQGGTKIHDLADVVIDNHGLPGDAVIEVGGAMIGPTSTAVGSALLHAIMARVGQLLLDRGIEPEVFSSANMADGDARNATLLAKYDPRIRAL